MFFFFINGYNIKQLILKKGIKMLANLIYNVILINTALSIVLVLATSLEVFTES